jgi:membrane-associated phospholipid phosphatase
MTSQKLAIWLSRIFHPFTVCVPSLFLAIHLDTGSLSEALRWSAISVIIFLVPLVIFVRQMLQAGRFSDADVSVRQERHPAYAAGSAALAVLLLVFLLAGAPRISRISLCTAIVASLIAAIINTFVTKISLHSLIMAGCATAITYLHPVGLVLAAGAAAVGWARVSLGQHTAGQVLAGWVVAVGSVITVFGLYL